MPGAQLSITEFDGLNLARERRQFLKPTLLEGRNTLIDAEGVYSAFGNQLISETSIADPANADTFRVESFIIIATVGVLLRYDSVNQRYYPVIQFTDTDEDYPWTMAQVGAVYYFGKYGVTGLIAYDSLTGYWSQQTGGDIPASIYGVAASAGRLLILSEGLASWSAIDDGTNLSASIVTGAGSQSLSVIGQGQPLSIKESDLGFVVFTKTGMATFELVTAVVVFKYRRIKTREVPINPYAIVNIEQGLIVYVAKTGFRQTNGGKPEPFQALAGEYFTRKVFPNIDLDVNPIVKLSYNEDRQWFIASVSSVARPHFYTWALVLYIPINKWGIFNRGHYGFGEVDLASGPYAGYNYGFFCQYGLLHKFIEIPRHEGTNVVNTDNIYFRPPGDYPIQLVTGAERFSSLGILMTENPSSFHGVPGVYELAEEVAQQDPDPIVIPTVVNAGEDIEYVDWNTASGDEDWNSDVGDEDWLGDPMELVMRCAGGMAAGIIYSDYTLANRNYRTIDSYAIVGLIRFSDGEFHDRMSTVSGFSIGTGIQTTFVYEDWNEIADGLSDEDWNADSGDEDWGSNFPTNNQFKLQITGTIDGTTVYNNQQFDLDPAFSFERSLEYRQTCTGVFHYIKITANELDESFHLKLIDISGTLGPRL